MGRAVRASCDPARAADDTTPRLLPCGHSGSPLAPEERQDVRRATWGRGAAVSTRTRLGPDTLSRHCVKARLFVQVLPLALPQSRVCVRTLGTVPTPGDSLWPTNAPPVGSARLPARNVPGFLVRKEPEGRGGTLGLLPGPRPPASPLAREHPHEVRKELQAHVSPSSSGPHQDRDAARALHSLPVAWESAEGLPSAKRRE